MDLGAALPIFLTLGTFLVVIAVAYAVRVLMNPERTARDRIADLTGSNKDTESLLLAPSTGSGKAWRFSELARPKDESSVQELRLKLLQAGFRSRRGMELFSVARVGLAFSLLAIALVATLGKVAVVYVAFFALFGFSVGYYGPLVYLDSRVRSRQETLMRSFPDALDLLVSSVEAGLGLDAAFSRVASEMESAAPELARELQLVNHEVAAGVPRVEALRHLDKRTGLEEVNSLVNVLMQAERFGTSVARALRVHSDLVRKKRMLAAEEKAAGISPKLTVVMILFIFPALFIVLVGPAVIQVIRNLLPTMAGE